MIPYSYNMVDMGGIDLAEANGTVVEGLYNRLALARNACGDLILFNWKFAEIEIAPGPCSTLDEGTTIVINGLIQVTEQDEVTVPGINHVLVPLDVQENGVYNPPAGVDGFSSVSVNVSDVPPLPSGYTKLNYIEGTGTQWIDTGLLAQSGFYIDMDLSIEANHMGWSPLFGGCDSNVVNSFSLGFSGMKLGALQYGASFSEEGMTGAVGTKYNVKMKNGTLVNKVFTTKLPAVSFTSVRHALIFARNIGANPEVSTANMRLYSLSIWIDDTLTRNYIPAMRDSDNVVGLFDVVSNTFFVNAGTGNFLYG